MADFKTITGIVIVILCINLALAVLIKRKKNQPLNPFTFLVFLISINFLNLILIQSGVLSPFLNYFGVYALGYGLTLKTYRFNALGISLSKKQKGLFTGALITTFAITTIQFLTKTKIQLFGLDDLETLPGILLLSYETLKGFESMRIDSKIDRTRKVLYYFSFFITVLLILEFLTSLLPLAGWSNKLIISIFIATYIFINTLLIIALRASNEKYISNHKKYSSSNLSTDELSLIGIQIKEFLDSNEDYHDPKFSLEQLSVRLDISKSQVSQAINSHFECSFFELINTYRAKEAIRILTNNTEELSIKQVMYSTGFTSKSTFIKYFKKLSNTTPSTFIKES
ncbi:MAG: helix-turn-helix domain-containing protein [Ekhidna sp.]|uniref:helix-turn-helix domain-containing protein n=1 Tax=Ekhidna sp. TaxID=2608089 RepID=UPI0032EF7572